VADDLLGFIFAPRPKKKPTQGADGIRMESVHPCSLLVAPFVRPPNVGSQNAPPPSHSMVASKHQAVEAVALAGLPNRNTGIATEQHVIAVAGRRAWLVGRTTAVRIYPKGFEQTGSL